MGRVEDFCNRDPNKYPISPAQLIPGVTFGYQDTHSPKLHLTIVLTPPDNIDGQLQVAIVNITEMNLRSDPTTELTRSDHPFIGKPSVIAYNRARFIPVDEIATYINNHFLMGKIHLKPNVLERIKKGIIDSEDTPDDVWEYCESLFSKS